MQGNDNNQSFFKRLIKSVTEPFRRSSTPKRETNKTKTKEKSIFKRVFKNFRNREGKVKGTTFRTPERKYSDGGFGWGSTKEQYDRKKLDNWVKNKPKGAVSKELKSKDIRSIAFDDKTIDRKTIVKYEKFVDEYNEKIEQARNKIVENAYKYLDEIVAKNLEAELERAVSRDKMRFTNAQFDDLRDLDFEQFVSKMAKGGEEEFARVLDSAYYNPNERYETYRDNYIKVMKEELGFNSISQEIEGVILDLPIDVFMVSYYDPSGEMHIEIWNPSPEKRGGAFYDDPAIERAKKALNYFKSLKEKSQ